MSSAQNRLRPAPKEPDGRYDGFCRSVDQALPHAGDPPADLGVGVVLHLGGIALGGEFDRGRGFHEPWSAAAIDLHRVALFLFDISEVHFALEFALHGPDFDVELAHVGVIDELQLLATWHHGGEDDRIEQGPPDLGDRCFEPILSCELHSNLSFAWATGLGGLEAAVVTRNCESAKSHRRRGGRSPCPEPWVRTGVVLDAD